MFFTLKNERLDKLQQFCYKYLHKPRNAVDAKNENEINPEIPLL